MQAVSTSRPRVAVPARSLTALAYAAGCAVVLAIFVRFVTPGYIAGFAPDDPMNLDIYWSSGWGRLLKGLVLFFSTYYRPMGGVYYATIYRFFGLNPLPYHVVKDALLLLNTFLAYRFAVLISNSRLLGALTAVLITFHGALAWLVYRPSFIYDVLCFTFFFLALNYYISIRRRGLIPTKLQAIGVALLYVGALDSKEMAVSLPVMVLLYEAIWHPPAWRSWLSLRNWLRGDVRLALILGALTAIYILGKTYGPHSLVTLDSYRPVISLRNFAQSNTRFVNELFYRRAPNLLTQFQCTLLWAAMVYLAWRLREKYLWFAALFIVVTPLPIAFVPGRGAACLYIPMVGWAVALSGIVLSIARLLQHEPSFRRVPVTAIRAALAIAAVFFIWKIDVREAGYAEPLAKSGELTASVMQQLRTLQPSVKPHTQVTFVNSPFGGWDMKFIADLTWNDHTIKVFVPQLHPSAEQIAGSDLVFSWDGKQLVRVKPDAAAASVR